MCVSRHYSSLCPSPLLDQGRIQVIIFRIASNHGAVRSDTAHIRTNYSKLQKGITTFFRKNNDFILITVCEIYK
ncbi:hypothetical protein ADK18_07690 [Bacillus anthracis]|nr:hypothetical protein ADK17_09265 [Bacillus anthracis]KOS29606.1 hypothetical protein ADK18_07690 [Bacillus anthracis]